MLGSNAEERRDSIQGEMAGDAWAAVEQLLDLGRLPGQELVAFEGRGAVEVGIAGTNIA